MCRRFVVNAKPQAVAKAFGATLEESFTPGQVFRPNDMVPTIVHSRKSGERELRTAKFGLIPSFAIDPSVGAKLYNCRSETVDIKPSFKASFEARRCVIPATAFYEWHLHNKVPFAVTPSKVDLFAFAGIWDRWRDEATGKVVVSCSVLTTDSAGSLAEIHQRMPVVLDGDAIDLWLDPKGKASDLKSLFRAYTKIQITEDDSVMAA